MEFSREGKVEGRVLTGTRHGGHMLAEERPSARAAELAAAQEGITRVGKPVSDEAFVEGTTPFGYLFTGLRDQFPDRHLPDDDPAAVVAALKALGAAMVEESPPPATDNSTIPAVYTYWGQFIDHDLTANTDRDSAVSDITRSDLAPLAPERVTENLRNLRQPALNLDSLYGDGPSFRGRPPTEAAGFYDGARFRIGTVATEANEGQPPIRGERIPPVDDLRRDLPRLDTAAQIGDDRNDENLIVAQLHLAFLRFHNAVVDWVTANEPRHRDERAVFTRARQLVRWHYQWLVVHDFLKTVTLPGVADQVLLGGNRHYEPRRRELFMPLEFAVASYRFGHSMVRGAYDFNRNFGSPGNVLPVASFDLLFRFTGQAEPPFVGATDVLPFNWIIEWDRMVDKGDPNPNHFARRIDTQLAPPLLALLNQGNSPDLSEEIRQILKRLATRNLLRGYLLAIPTGQGVAEALGVPPLSADELQQGNSEAVNDALRAGGFLERTPLWYYVLKEAEVRANGNSLGEVGSRVVCETIIGLVRFDRDSYLSQRGEWTPADGVRSPDGNLIVTIKDLLRFATVLA